MAEPEILEAARLGDLARVNGLLGSVQERGAYEKTALHLAAEHDHVDVAEALLAGGAELEAETDWGMTPLEWAATLGNRAVGELLLEHGAHTSLYVEAGLGRLEAVAACLVGADAVTVSQAFQVACRNGHTDVASFLLQRGAAIDHPGYFDAPGLHWAAVNGHAETVRFLLDRGADPTIRDSRFGADAVGWGQEGGDERVQALLASGDS
jgi:uncharacterized protein